MSEEKKAVKKAPAKKAAAKKTVKKESTGAGRTSVYSGKKITKLVKENPRREGTHGHNSFAVLKTGMTYEQYVAAGGRLQDLKFDVEKGYVKVA